MFFSFFSEPPYWGRSLLRHKYHIYDYLTQPFFSLFHLRTYTEHPQKASKKTKRQVQEEPPPEPALPNLQQKTLTAPTLKRMQLPAPALNLYTTILQDTPPPPSPPALRAGGEGRGEAPIHFNCAPIDGLLFCRGLWRFRMETTVTAASPLDGTSHCRRRRHRHRESFHLVRPAKVRGGLSAPQSFHSCWPRLCPHRGL